MVTLHSAIGTRMIIKRFHSYLLSVTVSVITIKGTESRLLELGRVADITGGQVDLLTSLVSLIPMSYIYRRSFSSSCVAFVRD